MNRFTREVLEKKYEEVRKARNILRDENLELGKEIKKLNKQVAKLQKDILDMSYLLEAKIK